MGREHATAVGRHRLVLFGRLTETATSDRELFDKMTGLYPDWVSNQSWLMFGLPLPTSLED
jgi:hypothetical protein